MTPTPYVYLASPVDQALPQTESDVVTWGQANPDNFEGARGVAFLAKCFLDNVEAVVFDPKKAWQVFSEPAPDGTLQRANLKVLEHCSHLVAVLPYGVPTLGVPVEVQYALDLRKRVLVLTDHSRSWVAAKWREDGAYVLDVAEGQATLDQRLLDLKEWFAWQS
ncbi:nucleoside deoxyribosyltransferase [Gordonia phage Sapo]|nr:nucleoside deoxyribosyltransferase [Gordonia phage Sapo]